MVRLTVILVRDAQTEAEIRYSGNPAVFDQELKEETVNDDLREYIGDQAGDERGKPGQVTLSQRVDPELTVNGYIEAQHALNQLLDALPEQRKIAFFSAPNKSCTATALMMSCADVSKRDNLTWRMSTFEAASAPAALPVVVANGLCNADPHVMRMGGYRGAVEGGLMHCAAMPWNDGRTKCPFMKVVKKMKEKTQKRIDDWDEARDSSGKKIHYVNSVVYLRLEKPRDPWSLKEMVPKVNIVTNFVEPKKYMLPPRQGVFDPKKNFKEWEEGVDKHVKDAVWLARLAGCDTIIMIVTGHTIRGVVKAAGGSSNVDTPPCCVASLTAIADTGASSASCLHWKFHKVTLAKALERNGREAIPPFGGSIDEVMHPHAGKDPGKAPANRWAAFPDPEPENLPRTYPKLPPFSKCLEIPMPPPPKRRPVPPMK